jgi:DNA polymerase III sliding clamp (beta) subunit (PCNA family)
MSKVVAEFTPKNLEKAIDVARHIATYGQIEFNAGYIRLRITDPAKVVYMDLMLTPDTYKCDQEFKFGVNLQMFYKLLKMLDRDISVEIDSDESVMKINQGTRFHTLVSQDVPFGSPEIVEFTGPKVILPTKSFQHYIRAIGNIAVDFEINYVPKADSLFLESVNSMYRTLFCMDTSFSPNDDFTEEYRKKFMVKFVDMTLNPSLCDKVELTLGDVLTVSYNLNDLSVIITVAGYTDA